ncbi:MAG: hypothetical protein NVS1B11_25570 [Terriglobales bacterium]
MLEEIVSEIEFDLAGNANNNPAGKELKDSLYSCDSQKQQRISDKFMLGYAEVEIIDRPPDNLGEKYPDSVVQKDADCPQNKAAPVLFHVGQEGMQALWQHVLVDAILPAAGSSHEWERLRGDHSRM